MDNVKNNNAERRVPIIEFDDPQMAIVAEFLMTDSPVIGKDVLQAIEQLEAINGKKNIEISGNRCYLIINKETTIIHDLYDGLYEDIELFPSCELKTRKIKRLIYSWLKERMDNK